MVPNSSGGRQLTRKSYMITLVCTISGKAISQEVQAPTFHDNRNMMMVRLRALHTSRLYPPGNTPVRSCVESRAMMRPVGLCQ
jgi:hypothetical protein